MSRVPMGKVLLWNVIRHTDAHNKIQEESEMWKMRDYEKHTPHQRNVPADCVRGSMHCDRVSDSSSRDQCGSRERASGHDDRESRYWTRKLYDFEANDPDRWGHSGFKELYPEEFQSDCEEAGGTKKKGRHKTKRSKHCAESAISKRSKKSSRKKKKKKKKRDEEEKRKRTQCSSSDSSSSSSDEGNSARCKQAKKRPKSKHKNKKASRNRERGEDGSSEESHNEGERERPTHSRRKRKQDTRRDSGSDSHKKRRRKNWKGANEENSDDSSGD